MSLKPNTLAYSGSYSFFFFKGHYRVSEMVQYIFTPWRDRRELLAVRRQFYPPQPQQQTQSNTTTTTIATRNRHTHTGHQIPPGQEDGGSSSSSKGEREREREKEKQSAVARVSMWMQRGGCPHMVESTALLTAAILSDEGSGSGIGDGTGEEGEGAARASRGYAVRAAYSAAFSR